jgi:hypothetical protein
MDEYRNNESLVSVGKSANPAGKKTFAVVVVECGCAFDAHAALI